MSTNKNKIEDVLRIESDGIRATMVIRKWSNPKTSSQKRETARYERWMHALLLEGLGIQMEIVNEWERVNLTRTDTKSCGPSLSQCAKQILEKKRLNGSTPNPCKDRGRVKDSRLRALAASNHTPGKLDDYIRTITKIQKAHVSEFVLRFPEKWNDPLFFVVYQNVRIPLLDLNADLDR
jgi:hypothetical protein